MHPTIEDIYTAMIETDRGVKEKVRIYDIGGLVSELWYIVHKIFAPQHLVLVYMNH